MKERIIALSGRIDSLNAAETERRIFAELGEQQGAAPVLDMEELEYISSAGLRVILHVRKSCPGLRIIGAGSAVYEILEMTGFTEMMPVEKAYRRISVEGCEVIGEGFNGKVCRIDRDTVVKVYKKGDALSGLRHEREVARLALILGVPTAIPYDVVRVGDSYGAVFELLNARSFSGILREEPEKLDWCIREYTRMLKKIHSIEVSAGRLPSAKQKLLARIGRIGPFLPDGCGERLRSLAERIPEDDHMIHGDYHTKNIVLSNGEVLLIDMDTLSVGHPVLELGQMYNSYVGFSELDPAVFRDFQGYDTALGRKLWRKTLEGYLETEDPEVLASVIDKARCVGYTMLIDWHSCQGEPKKEEDRGILGYWVRQLTELTKKTERLDF